MRKILLRARSVIRSIASLPAVIFLVFILIAFVQVAQTDENIDLPGLLGRLNITDLDTIRATLAAVITGVFTLTIFAYTMVMNVIDRSIGSYSPRLLPLIVSERYHQEILGVGAGTIAHSTILLLGVAEPPDAVSPPPLAAASAGFFAVLSLILFIYFIHRVSRSIHVNVLLYKSFCHTAKCLDVLLHRPEHYGWSDDKVETSGVTIDAAGCGYLDDVDLAGLARTGKVSALIARPGTFVYQGDPILQCVKGAELGEERLDRYFKISEDEPIDVYAVGFRHLVEVSIKAASPALNDPATALTAMHYLVQLFERLALVGRVNLYTASAGERPIRLNAWTPADLVRTCYPELRRYLNQDPWGVSAIRDGLHRIIAAYSQAEEAETVAAARQELALLHAQTS